MVPQDEVRSRGGTSRAPSIATEAGTSAFPSICHVDAGRHPDGLQPIVPVVATSREWSDDLGEPTFPPREGHRRPAGDPFGSEDVRFRLWELVLDPQVVGSPADDLPAGGEPHRDALVDATEFQTASHG